MRKILVSFLCALMIFSMLVPAYAAGSPTLTMSGANVEPGQDVELTLSISSNTGIAGLAVSLDYNKDVLSIKSCLDGKLFSSLTAGKNYIFDDSADVKTNGTLAKFVFTVNKSAPAGEYEIKVIVRSCTNAALNDVNCGTVSGKIKICGHKNLTKIPGTAATCTKAGLTDGVRCADCGKIITAQKEIKALGHDIVKDAAVPATCTAAGKTAGEHCSRCDYKIAQKDIAALGHAYVKQIIAATAEEKGYTLNTCSRCGDSYKSDYTDAAQKYLMCDVDFDGVLTAADARLILRCSVGLEVFSELQTKVALTGEDEKITAADARMALRMAVCLEKLRYVV